jgi:hypothetical protein
MPHESTANAMMVTGAFDRISGTRNEPIYQEYNNFTVRTVGGNIIQGQVNRIKVTEVMFPYAIPTIINFKDDIDAANNVIVINSVTQTFSGAGTISTTSSTARQVTLPVGFYTGLEIATAIQAIITAGGPVFAGLDVTWDDTTNRISWTNTNVWSGADAAPNYFYNILIYATGNNNPQIQLQKPRLAWTLGLRSMAAKYPAIAPSNAAATSPQFASPLTPWLTPTGYPNAAGVSVPALPVWPAPYASSVIVGSPYSGRYTDFIDIVSHNLCGAQYVRDGNTNQNTVRRDIVARLYVADEVSLAGNYETGSRPFLIHRQFKSPKTMYWNVERSIDSIDLQLYDMYGQPLPTGVGLGPGVVGDPGDYAVTFQVEEGTISEQLGNNGYRM